MAKTARRGKRQKTAVKGTMDITEQLKTWNNFWARLKWSSVAFIIILVLLAIFRTN